MRMTNIERQARWKAANPGRGKELQALWRAKNKDKVKASAARAWANCKDDPEVKRRAVDRATAWQKENKERRAVIRASYRSRKRRAIGTHTAGDVSDIFRLQRGKCASCSDKISGGYHVDHIMPLKLGGSNDRRNIQLLCGRCNCSKGPRHPIAFARSKGLLI